MSDKPTIIGLTGNIATGKSTVMALAQQRGADTIDADKVAHDVLTFDQVKVAIRDTFGDKVFDADGAVMRKALGEIVFSRIDLLQKLEEITHPAIRQTIVERMQASTASVLIVEAIKLLEGPLHTYCDQIWVTFCSPYMQIERLKQYRGLSQVEAEMRVNAQPAQHDKLLKADVVIDTNESLSATEAQFAAAWDNLHGTRFTN